MNIDHDFYSTLHDLEPLQNLEADQVEDEELHDYLSNISMFPYGNYGFVAYDNDETQETDVYFFMDNAPLWGNWIPVTRDTMEELLDVEFTDKLYELGEATGDLYAEWEAEENQL